MKKVLSVIALTLVIVFALSAVPFNAGRLFAPATEAAAEEDGVLLTLELWSDTHIGSGNALHFLENGVEVLNSEPKHADGIIVSGDLSNGGYADEYRDFYNTMAKVEGSKVVTANGNHDYGQTKSHEERRPVAIRYRNECVGVDSTKDYYSTDINGYKVIVLGDEGTKPNSAVISDTQLSWLGEELAEGAKDGKPCFVVCHWPLKGDHGEWFLWPIIPGGHIDSSSTRKIRSMMEHYSNVFFISGHLHAGLNGEFARRFFNSGCVKEKNGVTYISVPSFGQGNRFGIRDKGTGMHVTLTKDKLLIEGKNYLTGRNYEGYVYEIGVNNYNPETVPADPADPVTPVTPENPDSPETVNLPDETVIPESADNKQEAA